MRFARVYGLWNGLGLLLVGAVLLHPLGAQVRDTVTKRRDSTILAVPVPPGADSLLLDSLAKKGVRAEKRDSVKAPMARSEVPVEIGIAQTLRWTRDSIYTTGAITLTDLLSRVPGVSTYQAGWIGAPSSAAYLGDFRQIRVFVDGIEMPVLDPRSGGVLDLTQVNIFAAEEVVIEQAPQEVRVYIRTWRVRLTTPVTRADVSTGDQQTNLYRGYFGRRYDGGGVLQFGAQQFGTTPPRIFGNSSDQLALMARIGWANKHVSVDAFATHNSRHRGDIFGVGDFLIDTLPTLESTRTDAYLRVGTGDPDTSLVWAQVMAAGSNYQYTGIRNPVIIPITHADSLLAQVSLDTTISRTQYLATLGFNRGPLKLSVVERIYGGSRQTRSIPSARASFGMRALVISARTEAKGVDSIAHSDVTAQLTPFSFVSFIGGAGRATGRRALDSAFTTNYVRGEAGLRLFNLWLLGGVLRRDSTVLSGPIVFDSLFQRQPGAPATGLTAAVRGQLWRLIHVDLSAVRWGADTAFYRPRYQTRSELSIKTNLLRQFPTGDFGLQFSAVHEYRSGVLFPTRGIPSILEAPGYRTISTLLEIRILSATVSWQFRNFLGEPYVQVPAFRMPRQTNFYGVRWEFYN